MQPAEDEWWRRMERNATIDNSVRGSAPGATNEPMISLELMDTTCGPFSGPPDESYEWWESDICRGASSYKLRSMMQMDVSADCSSLEKGSSRSPSKVPVDAADPAAVTAPRGISAISFTGLHNFIHF
ncbi:hypothetical protein CEXT_82241 [Caerostris extrusa]|uniref:Uncharacterized protein n=1 Tax=Caerostris extrusa TaxID=172846 RepID=A0AAV4QWR1_CAEEX|nr:hypothetical protein CEXT_82241 [Caerostris extrusa]